MNAPAPVTQPLLLRALSGETAAAAADLVHAPGGAVSARISGAASQGEGFPAFCFNPQMAAEVTLQPMRRFAFDAAIVFADILLMPRALGQKVWFEAGEGPRLGPLPSNAALRAEIDASAERLASVGETLRLVRAELEPERALIGFAGGPWTVATYMMRRPFQRPNRSAHLRLRRAGGAGRTARHPGRGQRSLPGHAGESRGSGLATVRILGRATCRRMCSSGW